MSDMLFLGPICQIIALSIKSPFLFAYACRCDAIHWWMLCFSLLQLIFFLLVSFSCFLAILLPCSLPKQSNMRIKLTLLRAKKYELANVLFISNPYLLLALFHFLCFDCSTPAGRCCKHCTAGAGAHFNLAVITRYKCLVLLLLVFGFHGMQCQQ